MRKMQVTDSSPVRYALNVADADSPAVLEEISELLGHQLTFAHTDTIYCQACGNTTPKSYSQGHCYRCFKRLARCDLCVMAPQRCHYDKGTCREPEWGESFCMQPHYVYLANSSGLKVGITREGQQQTRWRDQGALQGRLIAKASSRRAAGQLEVALAKTFGDRSQWRALVSKDALLVDLDAEAARARSLVPDPGPDISWFDDDATQTEQLSYPVASWPELTRLNFKKTPSISGVLRGIKGQYLLFDTGVFNVREHTGYEVTLSILPPDEGQSEDGAADGASAAAPVAKSATQIDLF